MRRLLLALALAGSVVGLPVGATGQTPSIDDVLNLRRVGAPAISPDGRWVAYTVRETNWDENAYETEIWLADVQTDDHASAHQRARSPVRSRRGRPTAHGSRSSRIATTSGRSIASTLRGGEAEKLTSRRRRRRPRSRGRPTASRIAYTATEPKSDAIKDREKKYGEFALRRTRSPDDAPLRVRHRRARRRAADQRRLHRRQLRLVARRHAHRLRPSRLERTRRAAAPPTSPSSPSPTRRSAAGHAGRARLEPGLVAGRRADRLRVGDGASRSSSTRTASIATVAARRAARRRA